MTLSEARKIIAPIGFKLTFNSDYNEYRLVPPNGGEKQAYYTDDLQDAVGTAQAEHRRAEAKKNHVNNNSRRVRNDGIIHPFSLMNRKE